MKNLFLIAVLLFVGKTATAQVGINADNSGPDPSAMLDVKSTNKGAVLPRMTFTERNNISNPVEGLMVVCTNCSSSGQAVLCIYLNGKWQNIDYFCSTPSSPTSGTHTSDVTQITWKWNPMPIALGYKWSTSNNYSTALDVGTATSYIETGLTCVTPYTRYVWAYNDCGYGSARSLTDTTASIIFPAPTEGTHVPTLYQIVWNWNPVDGALGYKWNNVNNYNTATDMGTATTKTEPGLNCGANIIRFVWAFSTCGISSATILTQQSTSCPENCQPLTDSRDGKTYHTVLIGTQCWMKENLNVGARINHTVGQTNNSIIEKSCYDDIESNCDIYGGMYTWDELMNYTTSSNSNPSGRQGVCPAGWHLPSQAEWTQLATFLGGSNVAGGKMKEAGYSHWIQPNTSATNSSGFTGLAGGYTFSYDIFYYLQYFGFFWSATESTSLYSYWQCLEYASQALLSDYIDKSFMISGRCLKDCEPISLPVQGTHVPTNNQIIWNWSTVAGASGYKWSATNDFATAIEMGTATTKTETGLACNTGYTRYVWAYYGVCNSSAQTLTQSTTACYGCNETLTINHVTTNGVAPVDKTVSYGMVTGIPGELSKCWITRNLGANQQATAATDATELSAGWYWQFNRKQGYQNTGGTNNTPSWTITSISESSDWLTANDPCALELGSVWRIPTYTEWYNVDNAGGWSNYNGSFSSNLKIHAAGWLETTGTLNNRGSSGFYWSSIQNSTSQGNNIYLNSSNCNMNYSGKARGNTLRCLRDN